MRIERQPSVDPLKKILDLSCLLKIFRMMQNMENGVRDHTSCSLLEPDIPMCWSFIRLNQLMMNITEADSEVTIGCGVRSHSI